MKIGIVGHEAAKFTPALAEYTKNLIAGVVFLAIEEGRQPVVVSGACHLGGVDIWAEEVAEHLCVSTEIYPPLTRAWETGYKPRNIQIAEASDILHCIVVAELPADYTGMKFSSCYHCHTKDHVKSGGCWTAKYAQRLGKPAVWHVIR